MAGARKMAAGFMVMGARIAAGLTVVYRIVRLIALGTASCMTESS